MPNTPTSFTPTHWLHIAPELEFLCQYDMYTTVILKIRLRSQKGPKRGCAL